MFRDRTNRICGNLRQPQSTSMLVIINVLRLLEFKCIQFDVKNVAQPHQGPAGSVLPRTLPISTPTLFLRPRILRNAATPSANTCIAK